MIVSNSSPLIILAKINRLSLLEDLFDEVYIPKAVFEELIKGKKGAEIVKNKWIKTKEIRDKDFAEYLSKIIGRIGRGEAEAIILAKERKSKPPVISTIFNLNKFREQDQVPERNVWYFWLEASLHGIGQCLL